MKSGDTYQRVDSNDHPAEPCEVCEDGLVNCTSDPCESNPVPFRSPWRRGPIPGAGDLDVGWMLVRLGIAPTLPPGEPLTGLDMDRMWFQVPSPFVVAGSRTETSPFAHAAMDPRMVSDPALQVPYPALLHGIRNGAEFGFKVFSTRWLMERAMDPTIDATDAACVSGMRGNGEALGTLDTGIAAVPNGDIGALQYAVVRTHIELVGAACDIHVRAGDCDNPLVPYTGPRRAHNSRVHVFSVPAPGELEERWVAAVAAGFVTTGDPSAPTCQWLEYYSRALVVFYDVTHLVVGNDVLIDTDDDGDKPLLLAAAIGPRTQAEQAAADYLPSKAWAGHAMAVRTKAFCAGGEDPRTYAFVADLLGRVIAYDVSYDQLFLADPPAGPVLPDHPDAARLAPHAIYRLPVDPYDGWRPNCVDLEIRDDFTYVAAARGGVFVLDHTNIHDCAFEGIGDPPVPLFDLYEVLDTPGIATGLTFRQGFGGQHQLVVGDNRCGLRVYSQ